MTDKAVFHLAHAEARQRAKSAIDAAPDGWRVTVEPPRRSLDQNAALHARLTEIAARCTWAGQRHEVETWKRLLVGAWDRATGQPVRMLPALDGMGVEVVYRRTSSLSKRECSDLLEFVNAWAAERPEFEHV